MLARVFSLLVALVPVSVLASVEHTDVVPASISMTEYCGVVSVDTIDFADIPTRSDAVDEATVLFKILWDCPYGNYAWAFDGDATGYDIGNGAKILIRNYGRVLSNSSVHVHSGSVHSTPGMPAGYHSMGFYATLVDANDHTKTPATKVSWSGMVPFTINR